MGKGGGHAITYYGTGVPDHPAQSITFPDDEFSVESFTFTSKDIDGGIFSMEIYANPPGSPQDTFDGEFTLRYIQVEAKPIATSYIPTKGTNVTRAADILTLSQGGAKYMYRKYIDAMDVDNPAEYIPYNSRFASWCYLQQLVVWNREATPEELKALGVVNG